VGRDFQPLAALKFFSPYFNNPEKRGVIKTNCVHMINVTFSKFVKMNGRLWEVNFRKLSKGTNVFYADTATLQGERIQFQLEHPDGDQWKISGNALPNWLHDSSQSIGAAIELGLREYYPQLSADAAHTSQHGVA
jgi:hypothetical protein